MDKTLLDHVRGSDRTPGTFRTRQVHVGSDRGLVPAPPDRVADLIAELERYMNERLTTDCLVQAFLAHYQFETIHPFLDGNGRVGRLLLSLMVHIKCGLRSPWLYLSPYFERYKDEYIDRLFAVSTGGDFGGWVAFCLLPQGGRKAEEQGTAAGPRSRKGSRWARLRALVHCPDRALPRSQRHTSYL